MRLSFIAVIEPQQFRDLLLIRNECRDGMTHDNQEITTKDQRDQFMSKCWMWTGTTWYEPYLLYDAEWPIGYAMLHWDEQRYWMTIGVAKGWRGKGLSHILTAMITAVGHREGKEVWLDCNVDSLGLSAYRKFGYVEHFPSTPSGSDKLVMRHEA